MSVDRDFVATQEPFYCRTIAFKLALLKNLPEEVHIVSYVHAYETDPINGKWTVAHIDTDTENKVINTRIPKASQDISFVDALQHLVSFERMHLESMTIDEEGNDTPEFEIVGATAEDLGPLHFIEYAETNGVVFDTKGDPHTRPHRFAIPTNGAFSFMDLDRANQRWQEKDITEHRAVSLHLAPKTLAAFFQDAANVNENDIIDRVGDKRIAILDQYIQYLEKSFEKQVQYVEEYKQFGKSDLLYDEDNGALARLNAAENLIKKSFKEHSIPNIEIYKNFITEQQFFIYYLHTQALQSLNNEELYDRSVDATKEKQFTENSKSIKKRLKEAEKLFGRLPGITKTDIENMRKKAVTTPPAINTRLVDIVKDYKSNREKYLNAKKQGRPTHADMVLIHTANKAAV